jgi:5-methylcytosine-specific restriction endonuclease McrA
MSGLRQRKPRLKLPSREFAVLRNQVLERDKWRCQFCGSSNNLHVHHQRSRGRGGDDCSENLITLCADCHWSVHESFIPKQRPWKIVVALSLPSHMHTIV